MAADQEFYFQGHKNFYPPLSENRKRNTWKNIRPVGHGLVHSDDDHRFYSNMDHRHLAGT